MALLDRVGPLRFAAALRAAGAKPIRLPPGADPSLPLALGGAGITLREVAALYAGTRHRRRDRPAPPRPRASHSRLRPFVEPAVARMVADVLTQPFPGGGRPGIAWKTGTSWGGRDAWAFGFDRHRVVGVWIGRPDGTPLPGATGRALAVPLLARCSTFCRARPAGRAARPAAPARRAADPAPSDLRLLFPPPGAVLSGDGPVMLRAMGGRRPLRVPGGRREACRPSRRSRETRWIPPGAGFYRVTVLDADGEAARSTVSVK